MYNRDEHSEYENGTTSHTFSPCQHAEHHHQHHIILLRLDVVLQCYDHEKSGAQVLRDNVMMNMIVCGVGNTQKVLKALEDVQFDGWIYQILVVMLD